MCNHIGDPVRGISITEYVNLDEVNMTGAGPRRPAREVELDDIIWEGVRGGADDALDVLLKTHLALEALLIEMIALSQTKDDYLRWSFPKKTEFLKSTNHIGLSDKQAFDKINDARNDATHIFGHKVSVSDALLLARELEGLGIDFSDSMGHYPEEQAVEYYDGLRGIMSEVGWCILFQAAHLLQEAGGRDIFAGEARTT